MEFRDFYKEKSAREELRECGAEDLLLAELSDEECEERLNLINSINDQPNVSFMTKFKKGGFYPNGL